jgi:DNA-binding CsgD family transcriptional regulator/tetratricopeptide (TPR) repeat protein
MRSAIGWRLHGRVDELALVHEAVRSSSGIVLSGARGVGKTRLAREAAVELERDGAEVIWVRATEATAGLPFSAVAHLVPARLGGSPDALSLFQAVGQELRSRGRVVVALDDAHLLDQGSAGLVLHLAAGGAAFVLATVRAGVPCPDAVLSLWKDELAPRLEVQALSAIEVAAVLEDALDGPVERATLWRVFELTQGNPLFLRELVSSALAGGSLTPADGLWRWDGAVDATGLRELVAGRLQQLAEGERRVIDLVALSEPVPLHLLGECVAEQDLVAVERAGLVVVDERDDERLVRIDHPLYAEVLRAMSGAAARRAHHRALAAALAHEGADSSVDRLRLAAWSLEGGGDVPAELLVEAATAAHAGFDDVLAERLARAAIRAGAGLAGVLSLADALRGLNRADEAAAVLAEHEPAAAGTPLVWAYTVARAETLAADLGRAEETLAFLSRAEGWVVSDEWQRLVVALSLPALLAAGRYGEVVALGLPVAAHGDVVATTRVRAAVPVGLALVEVGRVAEAVALVDEATVLVAEVVDDLPRVMQELMRVRVAAMWTQGEWAELRPLVSWYYEEGNRQHDPRVLGPTSYVLGLVDFASGDVQQAVRWLVEAVGHLEVIDADGYLAACLARLAQATALTGAGETARAYLERARAAAAARPDEWLRVMEIGAAEIWTTAAEGDLPGARRVALSLSARLVEQPYNQALFLHDALRLGEPAAVVAPRLREFVARFPGPLCAAFAVHAEALRDGNGAELERLSEQLGALPAALLAAEVAAEAAVVHARAGDVRAARRAESRSQRWAAQCVGARTPALLGLRTPSLTSREREIAALAADGHTSAAIASRLTLSRRTVESHLYRAFDKLGVRTREQLRDVLP